MIISMIVAMGKQQQIGQDNKMLWHIPEDFKYFKETTMGKPMIMGRKTFESLPGVLPGRPHIIISRNSQYDLPDNCHLATDLEEAIAMAESLQVPDAKETVVIGGGEIYKVALEKVSRLYITEVHQRVEGDAFFPDIDPQKWREVERQDFKGDIDYSFVVYERQN